MRYYVISVLAVLVANIVFSIFANEFLLAHIFTVTAVTAEVVVIMLIVKRGDTDLKNLWIIFWVCAPTAFIAFASTIIRFY